MTSHITSSVATRYRSFVLWPVSSLKSDFVAFCCIPNLHVRFFSRYTVKCVYGLHLTAVCLCLPMCADVANVRRSCEHQSKERQMAQFQENPSTNMRNRGEVVLKSVTSTAACCSHFQLTPRNSQDFCVLPD